MNTPIQARYDAVIGPVDGLHLQVINYGTAVQEALAKLDNDSRLSDAAITKMSIDCLALHGAVRDACAAGWAIVAPMLLRTQIELLLGYTAIANARERSELLAYKYYFLSTKAVLRLPGLPSDKRKRQKGEAGRFREHVPQNLRAEAQDFVRKGRIESYWYSPDYKGPTDILDKVCSADLKDLYRAFSGGVHGGTLGIRSWRDIPDLDHPGPRGDPSAQSLAVSGSCAITMQVIHMRLIHRGITKDPVFDKLMTVNLRNRPLVENLFADAMGRAREYVERRQDEDLDGHGEE